MKKNAKQEILTKLEHLSEVEYKIFNSKIIPTKQFMFGVRIPILRKIAKEIIADDSIIFLELDKENIYEMVLLEGLVLSYMDTKFQELLPWIEQYLDKVDNWAQIDTPILSLKTIANEKKFTYKVVQRWLCSDKEYVVRAALVILLNNFVEKKYLKNIFALSQSVQDDAHYVFMANAWLISVCMAKYPSETLVFFESNTLDKKTHNKAIQKSLESFRVSKEHKELLRKLKI